jgi:hypothetical protein
MSAIERANQFWAEARERVLRVAEENGLAIRLAEHDDELLYDLFDYGSYEPTDDEIVEAIKEATEE